MMYEENELVITTYGELPKSCKECIFSSFGQRFCTITHREKPKFEYKDERCIYCNVLPKKHGRLGDLDALAEQIKDVYCKDCKRSKVMCKACEYGDILDEIEDAPTIIESSKERE